MTTPTECTVTATWRQEDGTWGTREIDAYETATVGLVVNRAFFLQPGHEGWWTVTHTATGMHLPSYFPAKSAAVSFSGDLAPLTDWTAEDPVRDERFHAAYRQAMARHGGVFRGDIEANPTNRQAG